MSNGFSTEEIEQRARAASYRDGLLELFAAAVLLIIALMWVISPGTVGIAAALIVIFGWRAVERVKRRITYPRIGYYQERSEDPGTTGRGMLTFIAVAIALMVGAVALSGGLTEVAEWRRAAPLLSGISLTGGFWYLGDRSRLIRHRVVAIYSVVSGIVLWAISSGETYEPVAWHLLGLALPLAAIGTWALIHFVRTTPTQSAALDG
jgi:phosphate/sulfate permease